MSIIDDLENLGEYEVRRGMANGRHGQPGSPLHMQVDDWLRFKEFEHNQPNSTSAEPLVFISYDTRDYKLVIAIDDILQRIFIGKLTTFIAKRDIRLGEAAFKKMLHDSLAKSAVVLAICTKNSLTSPWLWFESGAGFGISASALIPIWAGIEPQKEPMKIFQGINVESKAEVENLISEIAIITKINCENGALTEEEFDKLVQISKKLSACNDDNKNDRIEDKIKFPFEGPNGYKPVEYLIEAHFPLPNPIPLQRLTEVMEKSKIHIESTEVHYTEDYPYFGKNINKNIGNDIEILNTEQQKHFSNEERNYPRKEGMTYSVAVMG